MPNWMIDIAGWSAYLSVAGTVATMVTATLFFTADERWGPINDAVSVLQMVFMIPVAICLAWLAWSIAPWLVSLASVAGLAGMALVAWLQALLVAKKVTFEQTIAQVVASGAAVGVWLIAINALALGGGLLHSALGALGMAAGVGYLIAGVGFHRSGEQSSVFYAGGGLMMLAYSAWGIWLGAWLMSGAAA